MKQLVDANWRIPYIGGWCEGYVEGAWGLAELPKQDSNGNWYTTGVFKDAYVSWDSPGKRHYDYPPAGITVPVYFALGNGMPHVAIRLSDMKVASSTQGGYHPEGGFIHPNIEDMINVYAKYNNGCTYLGWREDLAGVQLVEEEIMDRQITDNELFYSYYNIMGIKISDKDMADWGLKGTGYIYANETIKDYCNRNKIDFYTYKEQSEAKINELQTALDDATNENIILTARIAELESKPVCEPCEKPQTISECLTLLLSLIFKKGEK